MKKTLGNPAEVLQPQQQKHRGTFVLDEGKREKHTEKPHTASFKPHFERLCQSWNEKLILPLPLNSKVPTNPSKVSSQSMSSVLWKGNMFWTLNGPAWLGLYIFYLFKVVGAVGRQGSKHTHKFTLSDSGMWQMPCFCMTTLRSNIIVLQMFH